DSLDVGEDALELFAVGNVQGHHDQGMQRLAGAFEMADVGGGAADGAGHLGENAGAILGAYAQVHRESGLGGAGPFDGDAALGFVEKIANVGAGGGVHGHAAAAGDVADDLIAGDGVAALGAMNHQVVVAANEDGGIVEAEHALDGGNELRRFLLGRLDERLAGSLRQNLARGPFAVDEGGIEIVGAGTAVFGGDTHEIGVGNFLQADAAATRFLLEHAAAHGDGFFALVQIDPVADLAAGAGGLNETEPVAAGGVAFLGEDFDDVAVGKDVAQRDDLAVGAGTHALVTDLGVDGVGKIHRGGAARQDDDAALGRKGVDLFGIKIHPERGEKLVRLLHLLNPLDELAHPDNTLVVGLGDGAAILVFPVGGD